MMEKENQIPEEITEPDIFDREEQCQKSIRVVRKAIFMRLFVAALILWAALRPSMGIWVYGMLALVILMDLAGVLPLWQEWKKQRKLLKTLIASEKD